MQAQTTNAVFSLKMHLYNFKKYLNDEFATEEYKKRIAHIFGI